MKDWINRHPSLAMWFVLAIGMVVILLITARDVGLQTSQWFWLIVMTVLTAGLCVWIISWGEEEDEVEA